MKFLMIAAVVLVVLFSGLVSVPFFRNQGAPVNKIVSSSSAPAAENNFSPYSGLNGLPNAFSKDMAGQQSGMASSGSVGVLDGTNSPLSGIYENLVSPQTKQSISPAAPSATTSTATQNILPLPVVADSEIKISPQGINNNGDYIAYFNEHYKDIQFDTSRLDTVLKNPQSGVFLLPAELVQKSLADNNFSETAYSLETENDFISIIINYLKSISVSNNIVPLHKQMIGFEELTQELIQKSLNQNGSQASLADLKNFYDGYLVTAAYENGEISQEASVGFLDNKNNFLGDLINDFGLAKIAEALTTLPVGGNILIVIPCTGGWVLHFRPPVPMPPVSGGIFVPDSFLASPLFYLYKQMLPSVWWLGTYLPVVIPCGLTPDVGNVIFMTGTSMPG